MTTVGQRFKKFLSNIQLTEKQIEDAITKHNGIRATLHNHYYDTQYISTKSSRETFYNRQIIESYFENKVLLDTSPTYYTSILVGSYGKNTAIAPPSDIDILFIMPNYEFNRYNSYSSNGQSKLLQDVKNVLIKRYPTTKIRADGQIVSVPFQTYSIEVLPAFKQQGDVFTFPDTHSGGSWRTTNPKAEMAIIRSSNKDSNGNTVRLIKMLKAWRAHCNVPIKSLVLELRIVNFLSNYKFKSESPLYYDLMIRDFFDQLLQYVNSSCQIPGIDEICYYGSIWESKVKMALIRAQKACELEFDQHRYLASDEWKKIFGDRFPNPSQL